MTINIFIVIINICALKESDKIFLYFNNIIFCASDKL